MCTLGSFRLALPCLILKFINYEVRDCEAPLRLIEMMTGLWSLLWQYPRKLNLLEMPIVLSHYITDFEIGWGKAGGERGMSLYLMMVDSPGSTLESLGGGFKTIDSGPWIRISRLKTKTKPTKKAKTVIQGQVFGMVIKMPRNGPYPILESTVTHPEITSDSS